MLAGAQTDENLNVTTPTEDQARDLVKRGKTAVAVIIPKGFGDAAGKAFFGNGDKPPLNLLNDPSRSIELAMVRGIMTQHVMEAVSREMFGGDQGRQLIDQTLPQVQSSSMPADQKRLLVEMLSSVQKFYNQPAGGRRADKRRASRASRCRTPCTRRR